MDRRAFAWINDTDDKIWYALKCGWKFAEASDFPEISGPDDYRISKKIDWSGNRAYLMCHENFSDFINV